MREAPGDGPSCSGRKWRFERFPKQSQSGKWGGWQASKRVSTTKKEECRKAGGWRRWHSAFSEGCARGTGTASRTHGQGIRSLQLDAQTDATQCCSRGSPPAMSHESSSRMGPAPPSRARAYTTASTGVGKRHKVNTHASSASCMRRQTLARSACSTCRCTGENGVRWAMPIGSQT